MAITLAKAMQKRKAELRPKVQASTPERDWQAKTKKRHVRIVFLKWLDIELPRDAEVQIREVSNPDGYHVDVKLPSADRVISLKRTLFLCGDYVSVWPLSRGPLWRAWQPGKKSRISRDFDNFVDAALYACGEAFVDESGNLRVCEQS